MAEIRKLRKGEVYPVEYICRMTAGNLSKKEPIVGNRIAKMYSTYYARECYDTCFVVADDEDKPVGYILCEPDCKRYRKLYRKNILICPELNILQWISAYMMQKV